MRERKMNLGAFLRDSYLVVFFFAKKIGPPPKISIVSLIILTSPAFSQAPVFHPFPLPNKYETLEIHKVLQDKTGFVWLATNKGLFKFDGINYRKFNHNLPDENVTALAEDPAGNIWFAFGNGKICFIEKNIIKSFAPEEGLSPAQVSDILFDKDGTLWFSTYGDGIYYYVNNRLFRLDDVDGMPDLYAYDLEEDSQGRVWAGTDGGIAICERKKNGVEIQTINYSNGLPDNIITKISKVSANTILLATQDAGLIRYDPLLSTAAPLLKDKWGYGSINDFLQVDNWIWVATDHGLIVIDGNSKIPAAKIQSPDRVSTLCSDAEGGVWLGSKIGVKRTIGQSLQFFEPEGDKNVLAVAIGKDGNIWFSTSRGLFRRAGENGTILTTFPLAGTWWMNKKVISLFADSDGFIWAGFYGQGAIRINPLNGAIKNFSNELLNGNVVNISGRKGTVWLATLGAHQRLKQMKIFPLKIIVRMMDLLPITCIRYSRTVKTGFGLLPTGQV